MSNEYYHVILQTKVRNAKDSPEFVYWFDCQNLQELDEDILTPYCTDGELYIDGRYIPLSNIDALTIKKSNIPIQQIVDDLNSRRSRNVLIVYSKANVVRSDRNLENVTKELVKSKQKTLKNKVIETTTSKAKITDNQKVFVVHGQDNAAKQEMARFLEKAGLEAIILHEQISSSKTIIEKIESFSEVGFAVVLYTPCDVGAKNSPSDTNLQPRARQNVVFEHGYFIGLLGRSKVSAFVKGDIEKPNDISGVVYTELDDAGAWKITLLRELRANNYNVNTDAIL
ncbi:TPA: TIR domain-containing protein [Providencia stuartii]|nr:nucleotide-binding protein [Providencia stuartii]